MRTPQYLPQCVVPKTSMRNLFGRREVQGRPSAPFHKVEVPIVHKLDHQVLSGEADSDEVRLLTVGGETEEDLFCRRSANLASFG